MTPEEEAVLQEASKVLEQASDDISKKQTEEHQKMMPHFGVYAKELIANSGDDPNGIHLFVLTEAGEVQPDAHNPLGLTSDAIGGRMSKYFTFTDIDEAREMMTTLPAAILFNEYMKTVNNHVALYVCGNGDISLLYCQGKLTVHRQIAGGETVTDTANIRKEEPNPFFNRVSVDEKHKMLATAMVYLAETGKVAERNTPSAYALMLRRTLESMGGGGDE